MEMHVEVEKWALMMVGQGVYALHTEHSVDPSLCHTAFKATAVSAVTSLARLLYYLSL